MARYSGTQRLEARKARLERHAAETDAGVVLKAAARYLELRSRSVAEVRRHLKVARFPESLVEQAIGRLLELGLLDDLAFGTAWVESRDRARPRGSQALRRELTLKGIDREMIDGLLSGRGDPGDATEAGSADERAADKLLQKNRVALGRVSEVRLRRQRAYALLARNGFDPEICRDMSARWVDAPDDSDVDVFEA